MTDKQIWFITACGARHGGEHRPGRPRRRARRRGHRPRPRSRGQGGREADDLLAVKLDITDPADAEAAVEAAVERFGHIDALVNNAANFYAGYFEEISPEQMRAQVETNLFGPMNLTRAVLPVTRRQRSGHVITFSSTAGLFGQEFCAAYATSKFGLEGWMESLHFDLEPYGIHTTIVEPGFFRTDLLVEDSSMIWPELSIDDYAERTAQTKAGWQSMNGQQAGDPAKLAAALVTLAGQENPPLRWVAGADAIAAVEQKAEDLLAQVDAHRGLCNLAHDDAQT